MAGYEIFYFSAIALHEYKFKILRRCSVVKGVMKLEDEHEIDGPGRNIDRRNVGSNSSNFSHLNLNLKTAFTEANQTTLKRDLHAVILTVNCTWLRSYLIKINACNIQCHHVIIFFSKISFRSSYELPFPKYHCKTFFYKSPRGLKMCKKKKKKRTIKECFFEFPCTDDFSNCIIHLQRILFFETCWKSYS